MSEVIFEDSPLADYFKELEKHNYQSFEFTKQQNQKNNIKLNRKKIIQENSHTLFFLIIQIYKEKIRNFALIELNHEVNLEKVKFYETKVQMKVDALERQKNLTKLSFFSSILGFNFMILKYFFKMNLFQPKFAIFTTLSLTSGSLIFSNVPAIKNKCYEKYIRIKNVHRNFLVSLEKFLNSSKLFDNTVNTCIRSIQELELISRGYRLCNKITVNDLNSSIKYYNHRKLRLKLKLVLLSAVGFLRESVKGFLDDEGKSHCLLDNIQFDFSEEQLLTISDFKAILNEIREIRTAYFLNEIFNFFTKLENSNEELQISWINFKSFKFIAFFDTLSTQFYDLFLELRDVLYRETMIPSVLENTNGNFKEVKNSNLKCAVNDKILKKRFLLRSLSSLDNNLHGLKVKILHCFKILNEDDKVVEKYDEFLKTFNTVGKDIEIISSDYQLAVLGATDDEKLLEETLKNEEVNSTFESKIKTVLQEFRINEDTPFTEELNVREELFEAETEIEDVSDIKKVLSREERIMLQRSERLEKEKLKLIVKPEILLLNELKNVLNCRKK